jgi:transposase InsO family protein
MSEKSNISRITLPVHPWHSLTAQEVSAELHTDALTGLSEGEARQRLAQFGPNQLREGKREPIWEEFLEEASFASFADACQRLDHWVAYYNHQRPHQGIDGACPADRFYGVAGDVEAAVRQGCAENSLRLALGQETR